MTPTESKQLLDSFIEEIKSEFKDQNWDYLKYIAERTLSKSAQPSPESVGELTQVEDNGETKASTIYADEKYPDADNDNEWFAAKHGFIAGARWRGEQKPSRPKIICYCGSIRKALDAFKKAEYDSLMRGEIALLPCCMFVDIEREYGAGSEYKQKADEQHKRKIDMCDEVFVLNVGGYIGESTRGEIEYANKIGKPVKYLES